MAVRLRLQRHGSNKRPFYRIVATNSTSPRDGRFIEIVGTYNPIVEPMAVNIDKEKTMKWLNNGAKPTNTVRSILSKEGIMKEFSDSKSKKS